MTDETETVRDWRTEQKERRERASQVVASLGLSVSSVFVPFSQSRSKDEKETDSEGKPTKRPRLSLNWRVTLIQKRPRDTYDATKEAPQMAFYEPREVLTTDYSAGIAHCPGYKPQTGDSRSGYERNCRVERECECGYPVKVIPPGIGHVYENRKRGPILPDPLDVLYSLVMDASVLDSRGFEDWAGEFGYDTDSRKAEAMYRDCLELALNLRNGIGEAGLTQLRTAFQDW